MQFSKEDLKGLYNWLPLPKHPSFDGSPTRRAFDRYNGAQVLFIINNLLEARKEFTKEEGMQIEKLIINKLPFASSSELTVFNWLNEELSRVESTVK